MKDLIFVLVRDVNKFDKNKFTCLVNSKYNTYFVTKSNTQLRLIPGFPFINYNDIVLEESGFVVNRGDDDIRCLIFQYLCNDHKSEYDNVYVISEDIDTHELSCMCSTIELNDTYTDFLYTSWFKKFEQIKLNKDNNWSEWKYGGEFFAASNLMAADCTMFRMSRSLVQCIKIFSKMYKRVPPVEILIPSVCSSYGLVLGVMKKSAHPQVELQDTLNYKPANDCVVFTSCGDRTRCDSLWADGNRCYDIVAVYYGDDDSVYQRYQQKFDLVIKRKASKFQNFFHVFRETDVLSKYEHYFVIDDDIVIDTNKINRMFEFSKKHDEVLICQPSFTKESKISHPVTKHLPGNRFRYTNFVEVNTPLFKRVAVDRLNDVYDDRLIGWGVDVLYIWINNNKLPVDDRCTNFAILDFITCINPKDANKQGGGRELYKLKDAKTRRKTWEDYARGLRIKVLKPRGKTLKAVK